MFDIAVNNFLLYYSKEFVKEPSVYYFVFLPLKLRKVTTIVT